MSETPDTGSPHDSDAAALEVCRTLSGKPGVFVAPAVPPRAALGALGCYLTLAPGESVLAVYDKTSGAFPPGGFTLTTHRVCWYDRPDEDDPALTQSVSGGPVAPALVQTSVRWLPYELLPEAVTVQQGRSPWLDLGHGLKLAPYQFQTKEATALAAALTALGRIKRTGDLTGAVSPADWDRAREAMTEVADWSDRLRRSRGGGYSFNDLARAATPRAFVAKGLMAACILVFVVMVFSGGSSAGSFSVPVLVDWGGCVGAMVAIDGEWWRLLTAVFLHGGLIHLAFNMWCLGSSGPFIERLYGNAGFLFLYLISGVGGSLASAWWHPMVVGVGASGAIFGMFGGLLAFLRVHRNAIPPTVLAPLRSNVMAFIGYNVLFGLSSSQVDNAAHIGGLVTGFLAGFVLQRPWVPSRPTQGVVRQVACGSLMLLAMVPCGMGVSAAVRRSPAVVSAQKEWDAPLADLKALLVSISPSIDKYNSLLLRLDALEGGMEGHPMNDPGPRTSLDAMIREARANADRLERAPAPNPELDEVRKVLAGSQAQLLRAMKALRAYLDRPDDQSLLDGPGGYRASSRSSAQGVRQFERLLNGYKARHGIVSADSNGPKKTAK